MTPVYQTATVPCPICGNSILAHLDPPDYSVGIFHYSVYELTPVAPDEDCGHIDEIGDMMYEDEDDPRIQAMLQHIP